jgi:quercetin 2,3-dioxygenase
MEVKKVERIIAPPPVHFVGDGFRVHNFIPSVPILSMRRMDPFIMMDYNSSYYFPPSDHQRGVGVHPHKGFETVTIAYKGKVAHHDSKGNSGVIEEGDVQWMTAASGILHKEYHELEFSKKGGDFQMVQLWVNLPAKFKFSEPRYQSIENDQIGKYYLSDELGRVEVIAGKYKDIEGKALTFSPVNLLNCSVKNNGVLDFSFPASYNTAIVVIEGTITINGDSEAKQDHFVLFENKGTEFSVKSEQNTKFLVLSGEPLNEPIAAYGPFVMNTRDQIVEAYNEFNSGKFGFLED